MSIDNIQATKFYDEVRTHFGLQSKKGVAINLVIDVGRNNDGVPFIGIFDANNADAIPMVLMSNPVGTGRRWSNELSSNGEAFNLVNVALIAFDKKKEEWKNKNIDFQLKDATDFLVDFMQKVSDFLR